MLVLASRQTANQAQESPRQDRPVVSGYAIMQLRKLKFLTGVPEGMASPRMPSHQSS